MIDVTTRLETGLTHKTYVLIKKMFIMKGIIAIKIIVYLVILILVKVRNMSR